MIPATAARSRHLLGRSWNFLGPMARLSKLSASLRCYASVPGFHEDRKPLRIAGLKRRQRGLVGRPGDVDFVKCLINKALPVVADFR
jgi:hypothetical protein